MIVVTDGLGVTVLMDTSEIRVVSKNPLIRPEQKTNSTHLAWADRASSMGGDNKIGDRATLLENTAVQVF